jgi:4,5-DOPA dioxygenase extradiol
MHPVLFIGHGSPMNALGNNAYAAALNALGKTLPMPKAILAISAHWETDGTQVLFANLPKTIHDFNGFPGELYEIQYPAPGAPELARRVEQLTGAKMVSDWGLDHGTWAVLRHIYPEANVRVTQLSLNRSLSSIEHVEFARKLKLLRQEGVLILASGNIVHNLREIDWREDAVPQPWAVEFDNAIKSAILKGDVTAITNFTGIDPVATRMSVPTPEHFIPLLYAMGASDTTDAITFPFEEMQNSSISMRSVRFG